MASTELGDLGPKEGEAVIYHWKWYYGTSSWALWVVLAAVFVLVKANRNRRALLILVPLLILSLLWIGFKKVMSFPTSSEVIFDPIVYSMVVSIAVVFLLGHKLGGRNRFITFLLVLGVMMVLWTVGAMSYIGMEFSNDMLGSVVYFASLALAILLGTILAGWFCRKRYSAKRFLIMLVLGCIITGVVFLFSFIVVYMVFESALRNNWRIIFIQIPIMGAVLGFISFVIILPFMILAFRSSFFRERFFACLGLQSMARAAEAEVYDGGPDEQGPAQQTAESDNLA